MMLCGPVSRWGRWGEGFERLIEQQNQTKLRRAGGGGVCEGRGGGHHATLKAAAT